MQSERRGNRLVRLLFKEKVSDRLTTGKLGRIFAGLVSRLAILTEPVLPSSRLNCERCTPFQHQPVLYTVEEVPHCGLVFTGSFYARRLDGHVQSVE